MVTRCFVCKKGEGDHRSFHRLPKNPGLRQKWRESLASKLMTSQTIDKLFLNDIRICSDHFDEKDFRYALSGKRLLADDAVPFPNERLNHPPNISRKTYTSSRTKCIVSSCKNRRGDEGIYFYCLTKERCDLWAQAINIDPAEKISSDDIICSEHFTPDSFINHNKQKSLTETAVPTLKIKPYSQPTVTIVIPDDQAPGVPWVSMATLPNHKPLLPKPPVVRLERVTTKDLQTSDGLLSIGQTSSGSPIVVPLVLNTPLGQSQPLVGSMMLPNNNSLLKKKCSQTTANIFQKKEFQCRTCLEVSDLRTSYPLTTCILNRRIKDVILHYIPEMVTAPMLSGMICKNCYQIVEAFLKFIERCGEVESTLKNITTEVQDSNEINCTEKLGVRNGREHTETHSNDVTSQENISAIKSEPIEIIQIKQDSDDDYIDDDHSLEDEVVFTEHSYSVNEPSIDLYLSDDSQDSKLGEGTLENREDDNNDGSAIIRDYVDMDGVSGMLRPRYDKEAVEVSVLDSVNDVSIQPHENIISTAPPKNFAQLVKTLSFNSVTIFQLNVSYQNPLPGVGKRILLLGQRICNCVFCDIRFANQEELQLHFKVSHPGMAPPDEPSPDSFDEIIRTKYKYTCRVCENGFQTVTSLRRHMQIAHKDYMPYQCAKCGKEFRIFESYKRHMDEVKELNNCNYRKCTVCKEVLSRDEYFEHKKTHRTIICEKCGKFFATQSQLARHAIKHKEKPKEKKEKLLCPVCGKLMAEKQGLAMHMKTHEAPGKYMCDKCPKIFITQVRLTNHQRSVHRKRKKQYECPECHKMLSTRDVLRSHVKLKHTKEISHQCNICEEAFVRGDYYRRHLKKHEMFGQNSDAVPQSSKRTTYKKFVTPKCKFCDKVFRNVYLLRQHVIVSHVINKRYKCKFCALTFTNATNKCRHEKRHKDPNFELSCKVCWRRFAAKEELELHAEKHKKSNKYICALCSERLPSKYHFQHHMSEKHISQEEVERETNYVLRDALEEYMVKDV